MRPTTSASNFEALTRCHGKHYMESRYTPEQLAGMDTDSEISQLGTLLHYAWANPERRTFLNEDNRRLLSTADQLLADAIAEVEAAEGLECRRYFEDREGECEVFDGAGITVITGHFDYRRRYYKDGIVIIAELKTGYIPVTAPEQNGQLMVYGASSLQYEVAHRVYLVTIEPRQKREDKLRMAVFDTEEMKKAVGYVVETMATYANGKEHPRTPNELSCKYCKAKLDCHEYIATMAPQILASNAEMTKADVPQFLANCDDEQMDRIGRAITFSGMIRDAWKAEAKRRIEAGQMEGYELKPGNSPRSVEDIKAAFELLADACNLPVGAFLSACSLSLGDLEKPVKAAAGLKSEAAAKRLINDTLQSVITTKQNEPSIQRIK